MKKQLLITAALLISFFCHATIINVPVDYSTIQAAIFASVDGDTVLVEPGIYYENINFRGHKIVVTSRYYMSKDTAFIRSTIINGSQAINPDTASCVIFNSGEDSTTVLQGFTITGGLGTVWLDIHGAGVYREGGGVLIELSSPTILNNLIIYNNTLPGGVGITSAGGGGIRIGDGQPAIRNNVIAFNTGRYGAGVVLNYTGVYLENNLICYNTGGQNYGGAGIWTGGTILNHNKYLINNTIANNHTTSQGGGIIVDGTVVIAKNNIFWGNTAAAMVFSQITVKNGGAMVATYNDVQVSFAGAGNINANPLFTDSLSFNLPANSPAVDKGDSSLIYNDTEDPMNVGNALYPSMNTLTNDMGVYGGPHAAILPLLYFIPTGLDEQRALDIYTSTFPNPAAEKFTCNYMLTKNTTIAISLTDITGKILFEENIENQSAGFYSKTFDVSKLQNGIYLLKLKSDSALVCRKVVVSK